MLNIPDAAAAAPDTVPVLVYDDRMRVRNVRPTIYHRNAEEDMRRAGTSGRIGYIVENAYGQKKTMTYKQYHRMHDLFEKRLLKVVDHWVDHSVAAEIALTGFDTEMSSLYSL
ncbi:MAG: hypothetical protein E6Q97_16180 [Desulfurellales bacterium]|nr:MAG: hypothetical protein E6Q97_16180 [Desulfurellales bacterium]